MSGRLEHPEARSAERSLMGRLAQIRTRRLLVSDLEAGAFDLGPGAIALLTASYRRALMSRQTGEIGSAPPGDAQWRSYTLHSGVL